MLGCSEVFAVQLIHLQHCLQLLNTTRYILGIATFAETVSLHCETIEVCSSVQYTYISFNMHNEMCVGTISYRFTAFIYNSKWLMVKPLQNGYFKIPSTNAKEED